MLTDFHQYVQVEALQLSMLWCTDNIGIKTSKSKLQDLPTLALFRGLTPVRALAQNIKGKGYCEENHISHPSSPQQIARQVLQKKLLSNLVIIMLCQSLKC